MHDIYLYSYTVLRCYSDIYICYCLIHVDLKENIFLYVQRQSLLTGHPMIFEVNVCTDFMNTNLKKNHFLPGGGGWEELSSWVTQDGEPAGYIHMCWGANHDQPHQQGGESYGLGLVVLAPIQRFLSTLFDWNVGYNPRYHFNPWAIVFRFSSNLTTL